ncbi:unnamed protein product, partial [Amoebophrya sp. A25]
AGPAQFVGIRLGANISAKAGQFLTRVATSDGADVLFCEAVTGEAQRYSDFCWQAYREDQQRQMTLRRQGNCVPGKVWHCALCPYKSFKHAISLASHVKRMHLVAKNDRKKKSLEHPLRGFMAIARALYDDTSKASQKKFP